MKKKNLKRLLDYAETDAANLYLLWQAAENEIARLHDLYVPPRNHQET